MWKYVAATGGGILLGLLVNYISPPFNRFIDCCFSWFFHLFNPDRFDLTGTWEHSFQEPTPNNVTQKRNIKEKVRLGHIGNHVTGEGLTDIQPRTFFYRCTILHNMVFGTYVKKGARGNIAGSGMIQLMVSPDRLNMEGQDTWYDTDTKRIESSSCNWVKLS